MYAELNQVVEDYARLWTVDGFAERFAATLARPHDADSSAGPYAAVLDEHRRLLVTAIRRSQRRAEVRDDRMPEPLADAVVGFYLSRRLGGGCLNDWATDAIATVLDS
jgi:hypothetical protein